MKILKFLLFFPFILCVGKADFLPLLGEESSVRPPAVANQFYPGDAATLRRAIDQYLRNSLPPTPESPLAIVVPHAGYIYSGQIAADAFRQASASPYDTIVILGTNHTVPGFHKIALSPAAAFKTPLGTVAIDQEVVQRLLKESPDCVSDAQPHAREHSIEVQVPFLQTLFPKARIVPAIVGAPDLSLCTRIGKLLATLLKDRKWLIIASSDLSHYPAVQGARQADPETLKAILRFDPGTFQDALDQEMKWGIPNLATAACGEAPILLAMSVVNALGAAHGRVISYANSGDTLMGEPDRVVGYGAVALFSGHGNSDLSGLNLIQPPKTETPLQSTDKKTLLAFARQTLQRYFDTETVPLPRGFDPRLYQPRGVFVTLKKNDNLRGCIGNLMADGPLCRLVGSMALQAAFNDRRFTPLQPEELSSLEIEISVLTPLHRIVKSSEIVVGRDGVVITKNGHSAVFLPQVATEQGWSRDEMLSQLCQKAGLPVDAWKDNAKFEVFQADVFHE
jgi:MEMO1 family protein